MCEEHKDQALTAEQGIQVADTEPKAETPETDSQPTEFHSLSDIPKEAGSAPFRVRVGLLFRRKPAERLTTLVDASKHRDGLLVATVADKNTKNPIYFSADVEYLGTHLEEKDGTKRRKHTWLHVTRKFAFTTKCCGSFFLSERSVKDAAFNLGVYDGQSPFKAAKAIAKAGLCPHPKKTDNFCCGNAGPIEWDEPSPLQTFLESKDDDLRETTKIFLDEVLGATNELTLPMLVGFRKSETPGISDALPEGIRNILRNVPKGMPEGTKTVEASALEFGLQILDFNSEGFFDRVNLVLPEIMVGTVDAEALKEGIGIDGPKFGLRLKLDVYPQARMEEVKDSKPKPPKAKVDLPKVF